VTNRGGGCVVFGNDGGGGKEMVMDIARLESMR